MEWPPFAVMYPMLSFWPYVAALLHVVLAVVASGHAVLSKRDTRAATGWVGMIWLAPPPFDHTKVMLVDGLWTLLGSANWDPRSLRLNFEFNVECYDRELATYLTDLVRSKMKQSRLLRLEDVDGRSLPKKLRDGLAGLLSPYL